MSENKLWGNRLNKQVKQKFVASLRPLNMVSNTEEEISHDSITKKIGETVKPNLLQHGPVIVLVSSLSNLRRLYESQ